jgi:hypothetical protein
MDVDRLEKMAEEWIIGALEEEVNHRLSEELPQLSLETRSIIGRNRQLAITKIIYGLAIREGLLLSDVLSKPAHADILFNSSIPRADNSGGGSASESGAGGPMRSAWGTQR